MAKLVETPLGMMTRDQIAVCFGLAKGTVIRRLWLYKLGSWPKERLFDPPVKWVRPVGGGRKRGVFPTPYGRLTLWQIADRTGLTVGCIKMRLYSRGWCWEDAFNTPLKGKPGKDRILSAEAYDAGMKALLLQERIKSNIWKKRVESHVAALRQRQVTEHA